MSPNSDVEAFGWTSVPRSRANVPDASTTDPENIKIDFDAVWPRSEIVQRVQDRVRDQLPKETYNHSLRVYCYGHTIVTQHFSSWIAVARERFFETWALTCLYHDIATTSQNRNSTHLSFEFQGGFLALQELQSFGAPHAQAESVCEAIIRHQDPGETGTISRMGQLVQLATEFDNMGWQPHLISKGVIEQVVRQHPRLKWSSCFASTIRTEIALKPWCHTTAIDGFAEAVEGNKLMESYD